MLMRCCGARHTFLTVDEAKECIEENPEHKTAVVLEGIDHIFTIASISILVIFLVENIMFMFAFHLSHLEWNSIGIIGLWKMGWTCVCFFATFAIKSLLQNHLLSVWSLRGFGVYGHWNLGYSPSSLGRKGLHFDILHSDCFGDSWQRWQRTSLETQRS